MPDEGEYYEAIRRIKEAQDSKSVELDLTGLECSNFFPPELADLTALKSLKFHLFGDDLSPLAGLTSLQSLQLRLDGLPWYGSSSRNLSPLAKPYLAPIAPALRVRALQRRLAPAGKAHLAPIARPHRVHWDSPVFSARIIAAHAA